MTLREKQSIFVLNVGKLILYAYDTLKIELTAGEFYRTQEQQEIYIEKGLSTVKRSKHQDRLAVDFNVFVNGKYRDDKEAYKELAEYWMGLNKNNFAGYYFKDFEDPYHFEMR